MSDMRAKALIAESATLHPDGTFSMLRAGITRVWGAVVPVPLNARLVVYFEGELGDAGNHQVEIMFLTEDGKEAVPKVQAQLSIPATGGESTLILGFNILFQSFGRHEIVVRVDNVVRDTAGFMVEKKS